MTAAPQTPRPAVGLPRRKAWAVVYLFALAVVLSAVSLFWINHEIHVIVAQQQAAQVKQSRGICEALVGLDDARDGAEFASPSRTGVPLSKSYGYRLAQHLHDVVQATHCRALLAGKAAPQDGK